MTCTVAGGPADRGHHANIGSVTGTAADGETLTDTDPAHYFGAVSRIRIKKFTNGRDAQRPTGPLIRPGDPVTWTYRVSNPGNVLIKTVRVTDDRRGRARLVGGDADGDRDLDPGEIWMYDDDGHRP